MKYRLSLLLSSFMFIVPVAPLPARGAQQPAGGQKSAAAAVQKPAATADGLKSSDPKVRAQAARDLGKGGDAASIPVLRAALNDSDPKVRREVVLALNQIHVPASLEPLAVASRDSDPGIRTLAVQCMVGYYTGQSPDVGFTGYFKRKASQAKGLFVTDDTRVDPGLEIDPVVLAALENALRDARTVQTQRAAAKGLGSLMARQAVPDLVKSAHSNDEDLALESLNALAKNKDVSSGPPLIDLLDSPNKSVKRQAALTVGILLAHDAIPKLQLIYQNNRDKKTQEQALQGLAYIGDPVSIPIFNRELWSQDKAYRVAAAEGLGRAGDKKNIPELQKAEPAEKDEGARMAMEFALTKLGKDDFLSSMVQELASKLHGTQAELYFVELGRDPNFLPKLYPYLNSQDAAVRRGLANVLLYAGDKSSVAPLQQLSHDPNGDVAAAAIRALRAVRQRAAAAK